MRTWRFITILLTSLSMGMAFCHLLELLPRMSYDAELYVRVTHTLYRMFGTVGAFIEVGAVVAGIVLCVLVRNRKPVLNLTLAGTVFLGVALLIWFLLVAPANATFATWTPEAVPPDWTEVRDQWEYTHAARAGLLVVGLSLFVWSVLVETPAGGSYRRPI